MDALAVVFDILVMDVGENARRIVVIFSLAHFRTQVQHIRRDFCRPRNLRYTSVKGSDGSKYLDR